LISNKNTFTKHKKQNTHWAACNSKIVHHECIYNEDVLKQRCKDDNSELTDKKLYIELVAAKKNQNIKTELFCEAVKDVIDN